MFCVGFCQGDLCACMIECDRIAIRLIAGVLSNEAIGAKLFISLRSGRATISHASLIYSNISAVVSRYVAGVFSVAFNQIPLRRMVSETCQSWPEKSFISRSKG